MDSINKEMASFEWNWTDQQQTFNFEPQGNALEIIMEIHEKYSPMYEISNY
jgi:hypothetical protein